MKRNQAGVFLLVIAVTGVALCSRSALLSGNSSSETSNGLTAVLYNADESPAAGATVRLRRSDYASQPPLLAKSAIYAADALTDAQGRFKIEGIDSGSYSVEVSENGVATLFTCVLGDQGIADLGTQILRPFGAVRGSIDTSGIAGKQLFVQVLGLERIVSADPSGTFLINNLPAGLFTFRVIAVSRSQTTIIRTDQASAVSGDTVSETMPGWGFSKKIVLNTTISGAGVPDNVVNFPVLVLLTNANFNFAQAGPGGADIRFVKQDNTPLSFEIEQWDASGQQAEIWVRVDTVFGNDSSHGFDMCWGNPGAVSSSNGAAVFDTANGFAGVWHLNEPSGDVFDATANADTGVSDGTASSPGAIGNGRAFTNSRISIGAGSILCTFSDSITVSGWLKSVQRPDSTVSVIRHIGNFTALQFSVSHEWTSFWTLLSTDYSAVDYPPWASNFGDGAWHYFTARFKAGQGCSVYKDGILLAQNTTDTASLKTSAGAFYLGGTESDNEYFDGCLDEIRIERAYRSAGWIKLCSMNQKTPDALTVFK